MQANLDGAERGVAGLDVERGAGCTAPPSVPGDRRFAVADDEVHGLELGSRPVIHDRKFTLLERFELSTSLRSSRSGDTRSIECPRRGLVILSGTVSAVAGIPPSDKNLVEAQFVAMLREMPR